MTKYIIGFFLGLMVASATAQIAVNGSLNSVLSSGVGPDGKTSVIRVDADGYVICSKELPK